MTRHVPYAEFRKNLAKYMDKVRDKPVYIKRNEGSVVMLSEEEYEGLLETLFLLRGNNAKELREAIADANAGRLEEHELIEE